MAGENDLMIAVLAIIIGTLAGIVWSLRILYSLDVKIANIEQHLFKIVSKVEREEEKIEKEEYAIEKAMKIKKK